QRPRPLPGAAGHAARGDAGQRGGGNGCPPARAGGRASRAGRRQRPVPAAARAGVGGGVGRPRAPRRGRTVASGGRLPAFPARVAAGTARSVGRRPRPAPAPPAVPVQPRTRTGRRQCARRRSGRRRRRVGARSMTLAPLTRTRRVIVCCGSGGVGKTTTAAVLALEGARQGRRAVVVTIDPAKRLADALGLDKLLDTPTLIE